MSGFAFAAIYKDPIPPGPGPDGPDIPPIDPDDDPENINYTISGESIKPFVPFSVTVTGSSSKAKGNGGNLQADIDYEIRDGGEWAGGKRTWELGTRVCDSSRTNAKFSWLIGGREPVTATLAYDAGTMTPDLAKDTLSLGETVGFTITYSHAQNCYATRFADFGASYWWEAQKNGTWERTNRIPVNQTPSFSNGVLSGNAYIGNLAGYDKIRLCVSYAGRNTVYAEASLVASEVTITLGDDALHCWGAGTQLKIESDMLEYMTAAFYRGGDTTEDITDLQGEPIVFGFSGTSWQGDIQAAGGATAGTVVLKVMYNGVVQATKEITIETEFLADITVSGQSIIQGNSFDMSGSVASTMGELSRIPANAFKLVAVQDDTTLAEINNVAGSQEVEYESVTPTVAGTVYVRIIDNRDGTTVAEEEVAVQSVKFALADAINERILANTGTAGTYSDEDSASTLRTAAISAINGYAKSAIAADGTFTAFSNSNHGIATATETTQWYAETYAIVKSAVAKQCNPSVSATLQGSRYSGNKDSNVSGSGTSQDPYVLEDKDLFKARVVSEGYNSSLDDDECQSQFSSYLHVIKGGTFEEGFVQGNSYAPHHASINYSYQCKKFKLTAYVSGNVDMYFTSASSPTNYATFGHAAPNALSTTAKCGAFQASANQESESGWVGGDGSGLPPEISQVGSRKGYMMTLNKAIIHYNFNHK